MENIPTQFERQLNSSVVDAHAVYKLPSESDVVTHRASMQIAPIEGGSDFQQNQVIRFRIRSGDFIDPSTVQLAMEYQQSTANGAAGADFARPANGMGCLFSRLTIYSGTGTVIEDIQEHNLLTSVMQLHSHTSNHERTVHMVSGGYAREVKASETNNAANDARGRRMGQTANTKERAYTGDTLAAAIIAYTRKYMGVAVVWTQEMELLTRRPFPAVREYFGQIETKYRETLPDQAGNQPQYADQELVEPQPSISPYNPQTIRRGQGHANQLLLSDDKTATKKLSQNSSNVK